jgi:hypothetical protein
MGSTGILHKTVQQQLRPGFGIHLLPAATGCRRCTPIQANSVPGHRTLSRDVVYWGHVRRAAEIRLAMPLPTHQSAEAACTTLTTLPANPAVER